MTIRYLITNAFGGGGTIRATINMANELAATHDVELVSVFRYVAKPKFEIAPEVRLRVLTDRSPQALRRRSTRSRVIGAVGDLVHGRPSRLIHDGERRYRQFSLLTDANLIRFLRSVRDGVLVTTRPGLNLAVARLARPSVALVAQEHINLAHHKRVRPALVDEIERRYRRFDLVATLTEGDAEDYRRLLGADAHVVAIPNAVQQADVRADPASKIVVAAGRLTRPKGFDRLVRAFGLVVGKYPDWRLRIYGVGDQDAALRALIARLGLGDHVAMMGFSTRLHKELARASIYAMSSRFEGFPMVLLEAMSCGLPVVSFDCPSGPRHVIEHGVNGLLVQDGDVDALADGLLELIEDNDRRATMAAAAVDTSSRYTTTAIAQQWSELFRKLQPTA